MKSSKNDSLDKSNLWNDSNNKSKNDIQTKRQNFILSTKYIVCDILEFKDCKENSGLSQ